MSIESYINPDFGTAEKIIFFIAAFIMTSVCILLIIGFTSLGRLIFRKNAEEEIYSDNIKRKIQLFYEMMISGSSVMSFSCAYIILNHIYSLLTSGTVSYAAYSGKAYFIDIWEGGKDFILLLLICLSCILNSILDKFIIPLKNISKDEKASVRLLAMFYVIIILVWLNHIGDESEYSPVMMYYLGLMVGRFIYFDASFMDFLTAIINAFKNIYVLILALTASGILCYLGFSLGFLLERNYYIMGVLYTNLFILAVIFIINLSHILNFILSRFDKQ
ncbi:hypothetical protein QYZ88_017080 [Lachnospiraceae bacterium C1.1]|nr:hypothetical protein [Lachnospiraceae bacterium C1.1]